MVQLSHLYMTTEKTIALTIQTFVSKVMSLLFNTLSRFVKDKKTAIPTGQYWFISPLTSSIARNLFGWPKSLFGFFCKILWNNPNEPEVLIFHLNHSNCSQGEYGSLCQSLTEIRVPKTITSLCQSKKREVSVWYVNPSEPTQLLRTTNSFKMFTRWSFNGLF